MLSYSDIIQDGDKRLRTKCSEVTFPLSKETLSRAKEMSTYLKMSQDDTLAHQYGLRSGVGLAAPQIGITERFFAVYTEDDEGVMYDAVIYNPKIIAHSEALTYLPNGEGCLSVDEEMPGIVPRYQKITVRGYDENGNMHTWKLRGFIAIVFQHEIDHLNGVMFYDHFNPQNPMTPPPNSTPLYEE